MIKRQTLRRFSTITICTAILMAAMVFHIKYQVVGIKQNLFQVNKSLLESAESQQVLRAEWEYLNKSSRLKALNTKHVGLKPVAMAQVASLDDFEATSRQDMKVMLASLN